MPLVVHTVGCDKFITVEVQLNIINFQGRENIVEDFCFTVINRQCVRLILPSHSVKFCFVFRYKLLNILVDFENVFGCELGIVAVHLIVVFRFHKERRVDVSQKLIRHFFKVGNKPLRVFGMIRNIILLDEFLKNREAQIT